MNIKQLDALVFKKKQQVHRINIIKQRIAVANVFKHAETCTACREAIETAAQMRQYEKAGEQASAILSSIRSKSVH